MSSSAKRGCAFANRREVALAGCAYVHGMKMLPIPQVDPSKIVWSQACLDMLGPLLAIALVTIGLWLMPIGIFILLYVVFLSVGFMAVYAEHRAESRHGHKR